jgi:hypothetical protein
MMFVSSVGSLLSQLLTLQAHLLLMPTGYGSGSIAAASRPGHQGSLGQYNDPGDSWTYKEVLALQLLPEADFAASKDLFQAQHMAPIEKPAMARSDISSRREDPSTDTQPGFSPSVPFGQPLFCLGHGLIDNLMVAEEGSCCCLR